MKEYSVKDVIANLVWNNNVDGLRKKLSEKKYFLNGACKYDASLLHMTKRYVEMTKFLLENGVCVDSLGNYHWTPLFGSRPEVAEILIKHGANINHKDKFGHTALYYAKTQNKDLAEVLEKHGAVAI